VEFSFVGPIQIAIPHDLRNHPQIRWIGPVPQDRTDNFYCNADLFVFPTFSDGFGLTQLEAQAWKLPIVTSRYCGEVVGDGKNGLLLPEVTPEAIATVIQRCLMDPMLLQELSRHSGRSEECSLDSIGKQWLNVFESER